MRQIIDLGAKASRVDQLPNKITFAQELQAGLWPYPENQRAQVAAHALALLETSDDAIFGEPVHIHALGCLMMATELSVTDSFYEDTYIAEARLKGRVGKFTYVDGARLNGICLAMFEATILTSATDPELSGQTFHAGMHVPVGAVASCMAA